MDRSTWIADRQENTEAQYAVHEAPAYDLDVDWITPAHLRFVDAIVESCPPGGLILAAACGTGRFIDRALGAGRAVIGVDQSAGMLAHARLAGLLCAFVIVAGCTSAPETSQPSVVPPATPEVTASGAPGTVEPVDVGDTTVGPGEAWIVGQRRVDLEGSDETGIYLVRPDGTGDHQLVPELDGSQMHGAWSPDGSQLVFIQENPDGTKELWIIGADGTDPRRAATCEYPCNNMIGPEWSPGDPRGIYVGRDEGLSKFMLSRLDLDTGEMTDVIVREDGATAESWRLSRDAKQALVVRANPTDLSHAAIFVVDLVTGEERQLTDYAYDLDRPDWMRDGGVVFNSPGLGTYNSGDAGPANLWVMDADGRNLRQLTRYTEDNSGATQPHVLKDGSGIVFTKVLDGTLRRPMAMVDIDGGNERLLTPTESRGSHIDIRPLP